MASLGGSLLFHDAVAAAQPRHVIVNGDEAGAVYFWAKRCLDLVAATVLLLLLAPLLVLVAIAILLDSPGSALFIQERVGSRQRTWNGRTSWEIRTFRVFKFRSMVSKADPAVHEAFIKAWVDGQVEAADEGPKFKLHNDARITRVGQVLRKLSLDELPQLLNVLKGDMSLVGPRPVPTYEVAAYDGWHYERLATLPGITGLWQVEGRGDVSFDEMMRMDIEYVRNKSLWRDIVLLLRTVPAVLSRHGAE
jgi:lipopolysaccharide/colanic/teichoic acid biosynthesis glycosyltransferase